jgi:cleavage and polyadenylation specificity factor subunit 1
MQCYTELTPPTAVSHSISLSFISSKSINLIVAKTSLLQIFDFKSVVTEASSGISNGDTAQDLTEANEFTGDITLQKVENTTKLVLVDEFVLSGTVSSLGRVKVLNSKYGTEALLIAFRDAKISLVQWDPERHSISTTSIHYYENAISTSPWAPDISHCPSQLSVDPSNRCAVLRFGPRQIAILPFRQLEDDLEDDYDPDIDGPREPAIEENAVTNGDSASNVTPYLSSFVLSLTSLTADLTFPIHLAFLYEYREPTFGILSSIRAPTVSANLERRDIVTYKVFTLDLEQKASTTLLSVSNLPTDLDRVVPLGLPVGGAILVGFNELVHIDQAGKTTSVAVNEFAKQSSNFAMADQSHLDIRLEGCTIESLGDSGNLLIVLASGGLVVASFVLDGRTVAGIKLHKVTALQGGNVPCGTCCATTIGRGRIFLGNEDNDSVLLGWSRKTLNISRKRSHIAAVQDEEDLSFDEDDIEDEDDIYGGGESGSKLLSRSISSEQIVPGALIFRIHDRLPNFAPIGEITFGKSNVSGEVKDSIAQKTELVYPSGRGRDGGLVVCHRDIVPEEQAQMSIGRSSSAWSFHAKSMSSRDQIAGGEEASLSADAAYQQFMIVSRSADDSTEESLLYSITPKGFTQIDQGDFDTEGGTVDVGIVAKGSWIVQAKSGELRCYNSSEYPLFKSYPYPFLINLSTKLSMYFRHMSKLVSGSSYCYIIWLRLHLCHLVQYNIF